MHTFARELSTVQFVSSNWYLASPRIQCQQRPLEEGAVLPEIACGVWALIDTNIRGAVTNNCKPQGIGANKLVAPSHSLPRMILQACGPRDTEKGAKTGPAMKTSLVRSQQGMRQEGRGCPWASGLGPARRRSHKWPLPSEAVVPRNVKEAFPRRTGYCQRQSKCPPKGALERRKPRRSQTRWPQQRPGRACRPGSPLSSR
jgi:hypothetical protein